MRSCSQTYWSSLSVAITSCSMFHVQCQPKEWFAKQNFSNRLAHYQSGENSARSAHSVRTLTSHRATRTSHRAKDSSLIYWFVCIKCCHERLRFKRRLLVFCIPNLRIHTVPLHMTRKSVEVCQQAVFS